MRCFTLLTLLVAATMAAPHKDHHRKCEQNKDDDEKAQHQQIEKRIDPITLAVLTGAATAAGGWATTEALDELKSITSASKNWKSARETFTKTVVDDMMKNIDADKSWLGAVCYNMGYDVDPSKRSDIVTVKFTSGRLNTDYDCMYLKSGAHWKGNGDGGFINIATNTIGGKCPYNSKERTITCQ